MIRTNPSPLLGFRVRGLGLLPPLRWQRRLGGVGLGPGGRQERQAEEEGNHRKSPGGSYGWNSGGWNFGGVGKGGAGGCFFVGGVIFGFFFGVKRNQKGSGHKKSRFLGISERNRESKMKEEGRVG